MTVRTAPSGSMLKSPVIPLKFFTIYIASCSAFPDSPVFIASATYIVASYPAAANKGCSGVSPFSEIFLSSSLYPGVSESQDVK